MFLTLHFFLQCPFCYELYLLYRHHHRRTTRTITTSGSPEGEATLVSRETSSSGSLSTGIRSSIIEANAGKKGRNGGVGSGDVGVGGVVQRVYSTDKITQSASLKGIKFQKVHSAEDKLQRTLSDIRQTVFRIPVQQVEVQTRRTKKKKEKSSIDKKNSSTDSVGDIKTKKEGKDMIDPEICISTDSTTSTENPASDDLESPPIVQIVNPVNDIQVHSNETQTQDEENQETTPQRSKSVGSSSRKRRRRRRRNSRRLNRVISVDQVCFSSQDCGSTSSIKSGLSVSTITGGHCSSIDDDSSTDRGVNDDDDSLADNDNDDSSDEDAESETFRYGNFHEVVPTPANIVSPGMLRGVDSDDSVISTDDFGSIAASIPPTMDDDIENPPTRLII